MVVNLFRVSLWRIGGTGSREPPGDAGGLEAAEVFPAGHLPGSGGEHEGAEGTAHDKSLENLLQVQLIHPGCAHSLRETALRARTEQVAKLFLDGVVEAAEEAAGQVAGALHRAVPRARRGTLRRSGIPGGTDAIRPTSARHCDDDRLMPQAKRSRGAGQVLHTTDQRGRPHANVN